MKAQLRIIELRATTEPPLGQPPEALANAIESQLGVLTANAKALLNVHVEVLEDLLAGFSHLRIDCVLKFALKFIKRLLDFLFGATRFENGEYAAFKVDAIFDGAEDVIAGAE